MTEPGPRNEVVWFTGADDGSEGFMVTLVQSDGSEHALFKIEPDGDAMAIGMMVASLDLAGCAGARWLHRESSS